MTPPIPSDLDACRLVRIEVYNDSGEEVPPHAPLRMTGTDDDGVITVEAPDADGTTDVLFNGPGAIAVDEYGTAYAAASPLVAALHEDDDLPAAGDPIGCEAGGWYLRTDQAGFRVLGTVGDRFSLVTPEPATGPGGGSEVSLVETQSVTSPPAGYLDAKLAEWVPGTGYVYGADIWLKNAGL